MRLAVERMGFGALGILVAVASSCHIVAGLDEYVDGTPTGGSAGTGGASGSSSSAGGNGGTGGNGGEGGCGDVQTDNNNCGQCGRMCATGYSCTQGRCGNEIVDVSSGDNHSCVLLRNGELWCWGGNDYGQLGHAPGGKPPNLNSADVICDPNNTKTYCQPMPSRVVLTEEVIDVEAGSRVTCVILKSGIVQCWGRNADQHWLLGKKGLAKCNSAEPNTECTHEPQTIAFAQTVDIAQIALALESACARAMNGDVYCWGFDGYGALGQGMPVTWSGTALPIKSPELLGRVTDLGAGYAYGHVCALRDDGTIWCWGANRYGQLGHDHGNAMGDLLDCGVGSFVCNPTPTQAFTGATVPKFTSVRLGLEHGCAVAMDNSVWCWGANQTGLRGDGMPTDGNPHAQPSLVQNIAGSAIDGFHLTGYALVNGEVWGWGWNGYAALGTGNGDGDACTTVPGNCASTPRKAQMPASHLGSFTQIAAGYAGAVTIDTENKVWVWGINNFGQMGHAPATATDIVCGNFPCTMMPVQLKGLPE